MGSAVAPRQRLTSGMVKDVLAEAGARSYPSKVAGLHYAAPDGTDRAAYALAHVRAGDMLGLVPEPDNPHSDRAVAYMHGRVHLGYVPEKHGWVSDAIEEGQHLFAVVIQVVADEDDAAVAGHIRTEIAVSAQPIVGLAHTNRALPEQLPPARVQHPALPPPQPRPRKAITSTHTIRWSTARSGQSGFYPGRAILVLALIAGGALWLGTDRSRKAVVAMPVAETTGSVRPIPHPQLDKTDKGAASIAAEAEQRRQALLRTMEAMRVQAQVTESPGATANVPMPRPNPMRLKREQKPLALTR